MRLSDIFIPPFTSGSSDAVTSIFSKERALQSMLDFEAALAVVEMQEQVIPAGMAETIATYCRMELFDLGELSKAAELVGNVAIPMVKHLTALVREKDAKAAGYVHWGATSQDAIDTGLVLQLRDALAVVEGQMSAVCDVLAGLTEQYRSTPMAGRTWMQQAVPVTFGLKTASWLDTMLRHRERLSELKLRVLVVQFGGAAGTLASLGARGTDVSRALAEELGLRLPDVPWHSHRDRVVEVATFCGLLVGTMGKVARDLSLMMQTEVGEVLEPAAEGRGGSSTMPHKRNPVAAAGILAVAVRVPGLVGTMLSAMVQEYERGLGGWQAEWEVLPEILKMTSQTLEKLWDTLAGLEVHTERMEKNLGKTNGLVMAEAVSMALAESMGRGQAHGLIEAASRRAVATQRHLLAVLKEDALVMQHLSAEQLEGLFNPLGYTGSAQAMIDRVLLSYAMVKTYGEVAR